MKQRVNVTYWTHGFHVFTLVNKNKILLVCIFEETVPHNPNICQYDSSQSRKKKKKKLSHKDFALQHEELSLYVGKQKTADPINPT